MASLMKRRKVSQKRKKQNDGVISGAMKSPIFTALLLLALLYFIFADSVVSNIVRKYTAEIKNVKGSFGGSVSVPREESMGSAANNSLPVATQQKREEEGEDSSDLMIPPPKATSAERMEWFRRKLPEIEILNSTDLSQRFHGRVLEFFNNKCSAQYFMVWLSSAQSFGPREFLAVDSLFSASPKGCLTILSRSLDSQKGYNILKPLLDRGFNILTVTPDLPFLVKNTPAEAWLDELKKGNVDPGSVPLFNHLSDLVRLAVLYKYGGVYLDTDVIFIKDLSGLRNAIGAQSIDKKTKKWSRLNGAVMIFDIYHPLLKEFLQEFAANFNGNRWGHTGPYLVSRVIERLGSKPQHKLKIYPPKTFYPVDWVKIVQLFKKPETEEEMKRADKTVNDINRSYTVHLWNKVSSKLKVEEGSVMERVISSHCVICKNILDP